ncbi:MAG: hypothetical protein WCO98_14160 [bacterium]
MSRNSQPVHRYQVNNIVIVNAGVNDPDYGNDIEGWQGKIIEIEDDDGEQLLTIAWDKDTLQNMDSSFISYCEQDSLNNEIMILDASEVTLVVSKKATTDETTSLGPQFQSLTRDSIKELADSLAVYQRGVQYLKSGAIHKFSATSHRIKAKVYGQYGDYTVEIVDAKNRLKMSCACQYDGDVCKHLIAVLLHFVDMDKTAIVDSSFPDAIRKTLTAMPQQELVNLIIEMANDREEFRRELMARIEISPQLIINQPRSSEQVKALKQQINEFVNAIEKRAEYGDYGDGYDDYDHGYYDEYDPEESSYPECTLTFETAKTLHPLDQMEVFWYLITSINSIDAEEPLCTSEAADAIIAYTQAVRMILHAPNERAAIQKILLDILNWEIGYTDCIESAIHKSINMLCDTVDDTRRLIDLLLKTDEKRFADWIAAYYLQIGDENSYLAIRQANMTKESQYLDLADYWLQHDKPDNAREVMEKYVVFICEQLDQQSNSGRYYSNSGGILDRLENDYKKLGDNTNLCRILHIKSRCRGLNIESYKQIRNLSQSLGTWAELKPLVISYTINNREMMARIYLVENEWDAALQLANEKTLYSSDNILSLVAYGVKEHRPKEALKILQKLVQNYIDQQNRTAYTTAAEYAEGIKNIYSTILKDNAGWQAYITKIRQRYPRHRALQDEFRNL